MLPLPQVEQWHHRRLLVLAGVPGEYLLYELLILRIELEGNREVVLGCVAVLFADQLEASDRPLSMPMRTTLRESLRLAAATWNVRLCSRTAARKTRALLFRAHGASIDDIVVCGREKSGVRTSSQVHLMCSHRRRRVRCGLRADPCMQIDRASYRYLYGSHDSVATTCTDVM